MEMPKWDFKPYIPSEDSPVINGAKCGNEWHINYDVRTPYKGHDRYVDRLPAIWGDLTAISGDLSVSLPIVTGQDFQISMSSAIAGAQEMLEEYDGDGLIDSKNRSAIQKMINLAKDYFNKAKSIQSYWDDHYTTKDGMVTWPLAHEEAINTCAGKVYPEKGEGWTGQETIEFDCPTQDDRDWHEKHRQMALDLIKAALINCRCAQEAAAAVGIYNKNKKNYQSHARNVLYAPKKSGLPQMKISGPITLPDPGEVPSAPSASASPKKKDNTLLLVGAAALGIMMLKK